MSNTSSSEDLSSKRTPRCTSCSAPLGEHGWRIPSKFCEREKKSSPLKHAATKYEDVDEEIVALEDDLVQLALEEEKQAKLCKVASLQRQVSEKRAKLQATAMHDDDCENFQLKPGPTNISALK